MKNTLTSLALIACSASAFAQEQPIQPEISTCEPPPIIPEISVCEGLFEQEELTEVLPEDGGEEFVDETVMEEVHLSECPLTEEKEPTVFICWFPDQVKPVDYEGETDFTWETGDDHSMVERTSTEDAVDSYANTVSTMANDSSAGGNLATSNTPSAATEQSVITRVDAKTVTTSLHKALEKTTAVKTNQRVFLR